MTFDEWQQKHGPNGGAYDIEMQRAGWDGRQAEIDVLKNCIAIYDKHDLVRDAQREIRVVIFGEPSFEKKLDKYLADEGAE